MDAAADFAAAKAMLTHALPAYVSYTVRSHVKFDAIVRDGTEQIVVRTSDGTVVKGKMPGSSPSGFHIATAGNSATEPVMHPAFKVACYEARGAKLQRFDGRDLEAISLRDTCSTKKEDQDFDTIYVDPRNHEPVAVDGTQGDEHVNARLTQHFTRVHDRALPSSLYVRVQGTGWMGWLDVLVDQHYDNYRFSATQP